MINMEVKATLKTYRQSPRKVRLLAGELVGQTVKGAKATLDTAPKRVAPVLLKLIRSAEANARSKNLGSEGLRIKGLKVDEGPTMFRMRPRAHGRAFVIRKRTSHITVVLSSEEDKKTEVSQKKAVPESKKKIPTDKNKKDKKKTTDKVVSKKKTAKV